MPNKKEYMKKYYIKNRQRILERNEQYHQANYQQIVEYKKQYYEINRENYRISSQKRRKNNIEKVRKADLKHYNKRKRNLGFNPLNKYFEGSEAHHINKNDVLYILKSLHRSISHCLETGRNMDKINRLAMESIL